MTRPPIRRRPRSKKDRSRSAVQRIETVTIETIGAQGNGVGRFADGVRAFVPFALPGDRLVLETVRARDDGFLCRAREWLERAARQVPICPMFETCGGCRMQHLAVADYERWKSDQVRVHLQRHGIEAELAPLVRVPAASRRRVDLAAIRTAAGVVLGFHAPESEHIVDIGECPLLVPALNLMIGPLRNLLNDILPVSGSRADILATALPDGAQDLLIVRDSEPTLADRERIAGFAEGSPIARISWRSGRGEAEPVIVKRDVMLTIGTTLVPLPIGCFLQPSTEGEAALQSLVEAGLGSVSCVADLYSGIGTFALDLASRGMQVLAIDGVAEQIKSLTLAAGRAGLGGRIKAEVRDLKSHPLAAAEMNGLDAVVFDPPRAGAATQAIEIAKATIRRCVAVSCNPATLARDLAALQGGGFKVERITPLDQFPYTRHVEAVAVLSR